jgi:hypothetical protein
MSETHKSLAAAQHAVMCEIAYVKKEKSDGLGYSFASEHELIAKLRPLMVANKIVVAPIKANMHESGGYKTAKGKDMVFGLGTMVFRFRHVDSGEFEDVEVFTEASDSSDKRGPKMNTGALKYALRQFFVIETGDDPDYMANERHGIVSDSVSRARTAIIAATEERKLDAIAAAFSNPKSGITSDDIPALQELVNIQRAKISAQKGGTNGHNQPPHKQGQAHQARS